MKYTIALVITFLILLCIGFYFYLQRNDTAKMESPILGVTSEENEKEIKTEQQNENTQTVKTTEASSSALLTLPKYMSQTFNNCGPATLSMTMSFWGTNISQQTLAAQMRPFNNPKGGIDDKSIFAEEFVSYAKQYGFKSLHRPNGDIEKFKKLTTNGIPVVVRTWLHPNEDIGHFRIVRGFDENQKIVIQDDSYEGKNRKISYAEFEKIWQPFNYGYILVYPDDKQDIVNAILGEEVDINKSYENAIKKSEKELTNNPNDFYARFNLATANYYLGNFEQTVTEFEKVETKLPPRMIWYQLEPMLSYQQMGKDEKALSIADKILNNGNTAFSEMYQLKGEIYLKQGKKDQAKQQFEKALYYNKNYDKAKDSLKML